MTVVAIAMGSLIAGNQALADEKIECDLYIATSMDSEATTSVDIENSAVSLDALRRSGFCVAGDGRVFDKQFVMVELIKEEGKAGSNQGFSTYTEKSGDSLITEFSGSWGNEGFSGKYNILDGTGKYKGATGDGTITGMESPWKTAGMVKIVLNVKQP